MERSRRNRLLAAAAIATMLAMPMTRGATAQAADQLKLKVGESAPDFKLQYWDGHDLKDVHLSDYRGKKNVVLAFYVFAFTGG
jgi:AhpC/TSA family